MGARWTLDSNTTAGDRLLCVGNAAVHLSTGDLVMLVNSPDVADPNKITLQLVPGTAHTTPATIATLNAASGGVGVGTFSLAFPEPQTLALCRDASDNLYIFGSYNDQHTLAYQAFVKQSGSLTWIAAPANAQGGMSPTYMPFALAATWCNTGGGTGGAGHLVVAVSTNSTQSGCFILDAGKVLTGAGAITQVTTNPAFLGAGSSATSGSNISISNQGFGATTGMAISALTATSVQYGSWGVSATGLLTSGFPLIGTATCGTLSHTTKLRIAYVETNGWAIAYPSAATAGHLTISLINPVLGTLSSIDTATTSNFPTPSATLSWDVAAGPLTVQTLWVYGWSSGTATTMLRVPITFPSSVATLGAVVTDDTSVGSAGTTIRSVKEPVDFAHTDWQAYQSTSAYALLGDFSAIPTTPYLPQLVSPSNGATVSTSFLFDWNFLSPLLGDAQATYYLRFFSVAGSGYQWWNGSSLTAGQAGATGGNEVAVSTATTSATVTLTAGRTYQWSVQVTGSSAVISGYANALTVTAATPPGTPSLTATYDSTNNRVTLVVAGTGAYNAWFEYSDDGTNWFTVRGSSAVTQSSGAATVYDWEAPPGAARSYRVAQINPADTVANNWSAWSSTQTATPSITTFWLRDPQAMTLGINPKVQRGTLATSFNENLTEHQPLGRTDTVIVADVIGLEDGGCTFMTYSTSDENALLALVKSQRTLLFQSPDNRQWYTRWNVPRPVNTPYLVQAGSYREHALTWRAQQRP